MLETNANPALPAKNRVSKLLHRLPYGIGPGKLSVLDLPAQDEEPQDDTEVESLEGADADEELFEFCKKYGWGCGIEQPETALFPDHDTIAEDDLKQKTEVEHQAIALHYLARSLHEHVTRACSKELPDDESLDAESESHLLSILARKQAVKLLRGRAGCVSKRMLHVFCVVTQDPSPVCKRTIDEPGSKTGKQVAVWPAQFFLNTFVAESLMVRAVPYDQGTPIVLLIGEHGTDTMPGWGREPVTSVMGLGFRGSWLRVVIPGEAEAWARYESDDHSIRYLIREGDRVPNYPRRFIVNGKSVTKPLPLFKHPYVGAPPSAITELKPWEIVLGLQRLGRWLRVVRFVPPLIDRKRDGKVKSTAGSPTSDPKILAWVQMRLCVTSAVRVYPYPIPNGYCANDRNILCDATRDVDQICNPTKFSVQNFCRLAGRCAGNDRIACSRESDCGIDAPCVMINLVGGRCHLDSDSICVEDIDCLGEDNARTGPCVKKGVCNHDLTKGCEKDKDCYGRESSAEERGERQCIFGRCGRLPTVRLPVLHHRAVRDQTHLHTFYMAKLIATRFRWRATANTTVEPMAAACSAKFVQMTAIAVPEMIRWCLLLWLSCTCA